jgi:hypothetical protein
MQIKNQQIKREQNEITEIYFDFYNYFKIRSLSLYKNENP